MTDSTTRSPRTGAVCLDCPEWMWDEQPNGMYGIDAHPDVRGHAAPPHQWRGAELVPVAEAAAPDAGLRHKNAAGVEFITVECPVCYYQHAHTVEAEATAPDAGLREAIEHELALVGDKPDPFDSGAAAAYNFVLSLLAGHPATAPDAGLREALERIANTTSDYQTEQDARAALAAHPAPVPDPEADGRTNEQQMIDGDRRPHPAPAPDPTGDAE